MIYAENRADDFGRIQADTEHAEKMEITEKALLPELITGCRDLICKVMSMAEVLDAALLSNETIIEQTKVAWYLRTMADMLDDAEKDLERAERAALKGSD